jgi:hypothetical protein
MLKRLNKKINLQLFFRILTKLLGKYLIKYRQSAEYIWYIFYGQNSAIEISGS